MAFLVILLVLLALFLGSLAFGILVYRRSFQCRFPGGGDYFPYFSQLHPTWHRRPVAFPSNRGDRLRGDLFSYDGPQKGLIALCHGYGMTRNDYLPECEFFCQSGYSVLAFDGSGTGDSDGLLYGLPQHILDLATCLRFIRQDPELHSLPLLLYGHSWGGYSVDCVCLTGTYPIRGIISASAFQVSTAGIGPYMERHWGLAAKLPLLGVRLYQRMKFGAIAGATAVKGLRLTDAPVLILQSSDDTIIRYRDNYQVLYAAFQNDPNKTFLPLTGHNHNITTPPEVDQAKRRLLKPLRSGTATPEQLQEMDRLKAQVDKELLRRFTAFYDQCIQ